MASPAATDTTERQSDASEKRMASEIEDCFQRVPEDRALLDVNDNISGKRWKMFFRRLGLTDTDIYTIEYRTSDLKEQTWQLLCKWREVQGAQATFRQLKNAALRNEQKDLANKIEGIATGTYSADVDQKSGRLETILEKFMAFLTRHLLHQRQDMPTQKSCEAPTRPQNLINSQGDDDPSNAPEEDTPANESVIPPDQDSVPLFNTSQKWPYSYLGSCLLKNVAIGALLALIILQLWVNIVLGVLAIHQHTFERHSVRDWFFLLLSVFLRFFSLCLLPLLVLVVAAHALARRLDGVSSSISLRQEIEKKGNGPVLTAVVAHFWDQTALNKDHGTILTDLSRQLAFEFQMMCITSICEAFLITLAFARIGITGFSPRDYSLPEDLNDTMCMLVELLHGSYYFVLLFFIGLLASIYYHEATVNRLVASAVELVDYSHWYRVKPSKKLLEAAKNAVNRFNNKWGECETIIVVAVQIYVLALSIFASSGQPISGNKNIHVTGENVHLHWLFFVVYFSLCHFLATCVWPSAHSSAPYQMIGVFFQLCGVVVLYISQPPQLGSVLHILYAIVPAAYFFWFLWLKVHQENSIRRAKPTGVRKQHGGRIVMMVGLMILICTAITVCLISELSIIHSSKQSAPVENCYVAAN